MSDQPTYWLWRGEFDADYEIPHEIDALVGAGDLVDCSWHNDVCPSFTTPAIDAIENERGMGPVLRLWVEHPYPKMRECGPDVPRYFVGGVKADGEPLVVFESETDLAGALAALRAYPVANL